MDTTNEMRVTKRNGELQEVAFDKILERIKKLGQEADIHINNSSLVMKVIDQLYDKIPTSKIDELAAEQCAALSANHPDYSTLAARIVVSNHQKNTDASFSNVMKSLYQFTNLKGENKSLVSQSLWDFTQHYSEQLDNMIDSERDYLIDYFGFKTLEKSYLFRVNNVIVERPQHMWMRVSVGIHGSSISDENLLLVKETYDLMSQKYFTHATPTLFNAGTPRPQLSSCYLIAMEDDSIDGIYNTLKDCAQISKYSGGIGLHIHNIRAKGSHIQGTNGKTDGLVPMLRVFNSTARYVNQCFAPDGWVYSKQGPKQFKDVTTTDELVTIDGTFKRVNEVIVNQVDKEILEIRIINSMFPIKVTKEHELYLIKNRNVPNENLGNPDYSVIINELENKIIQPNFYSASELNENDLVGFPIPTFEEDNNIDDLHFYYFYGLMLRSGYINDTDSVILLDDTEGATFVNYYLTKLNVNFIQIENKFTWLNGNNSNLLISKELLYDEHNNKIIHSSFINLPKHKIVRIIDGLYKNNPWNKVSTSSLTLIMQIRYVLLRLGMLTFGNLHNNVYTIELDPVVTCFEHNGILWSGVKSITNITYCGDVYDFNMIDNHNYLTDMGVVHNSGKRNGSFAIYLEPWHADIEEFLELRKNHGDEELKARDLFYALWISDLFMERVRDNLNWSLCCPNECPGLADVYGDKFKELYEKYEIDGKMKKTVSARELWFKILDAQMETGTPYILFKDAVNKKTNQQNLGTIKSSNLCCEITEYSDEYETAVCNLASIALPTFIVNNTFDFERLHEVTKVVTNNLNKLIDINFYPTYKTRRSNFRHRPIGIGIQGLSDAFIMLNIPYHSEEAKELNKMIFETIYHAALEKSNSIAIEREMYIKTNLKSNFDIIDHLNEWDSKGILNGLYKKVKDPYTFCGAYSSFEGSPSSKGILQFDMWNITPSDRYDWSTLKQSIINHGTRNSLLVSPMPTASTSQILGFNECFEPITSNLYSRRTMAGEFVVVNKYLMKELISLGLWNEQIKNNIIANKGSIQQLTVLSEHIRNKYKIVWEMPMKHLIDMSADRGAFICQSQSLNLWLEDPTYNSLTSMHFYSWKKGLKTGIYYLRRKAKHQAQQFTIEPESREQPEEDICEMCSA